MPEMFVMPFRAAFDSSNRTIPGAQAYFTLTGTNTESPVYTDSGLSIAHSNPLVANGVGRFPRAYLDPSVTYRVRVYAADADVTIDTPTEEYDPYTGAEQGSVGLPGGDGSLSGLFTDIADHLGGAGITIPDASIIQTSGYAAVDKGSAVYVYDAAVNGAYVAAHPRSSFVSLNARGFRLSTEQEITPEMFGAIGDGTTDDSAAEAAFSAHRIAFATTGVGYSVGLPRGSIPARISYQGTTTTDLQGSGVLEGEGGGLYPGGSSVLKYAANTTGIRVQFANTSGESTYDGALTSPSGTGTIIRQLALQGSNTGSDATHPGVRIRAPAVVEDVLIDGFAGDGITANAQLGVLGTNYGNASHSQVWRCTIQNCLNGVKFEGADASIFTVGFGSLNSNRGYGYADYSLLGGLWIGLHAAVNALGNYHTHDAAEQAGAFPTLLHCYSESGSPAPTFSPRTLRVGGSWNGDETGGGYVYALGNRVRVNALGSDGNLDAKGALIDLGPVTGTADLGVTLRTMGSQTSIAFTRNDLAITDGYITNISGTTYFNSTSSVHLRAGGSDILNISSTGADLQSGKVLSVAGTQVVGARQTGTPADATDLATALTLVNALKTKLIAHGLIS